MQTRTHKTARGAIFPATPLGLGSAPLGDLFDRLDEQIAFDTIRGAYASGVRVFDTSPHYGNGLAEAQFGAALRGLPRETFTVSTKVGRVMDPFSAPAPRNPDVTAPGFAGGFPHRARFDYSYDGAMRAVEQSLLRTGFDHFDILLIHDCDVWTQGADQIDRVFGEAMEGAYKALDRLRQDGTVKAIGIGVNEADMCERFARAGDFDVMMLAGRYSLLEQPALASFLPLAVERKIGILFAGIFNSGILATGPVPGARYNYGPAPAEVMTRVGAIAEVCARHGVPLHRAALHFVTFHSAVLSVVLGAVTAAETAANARALAEPVPAALWSDLKTAGLLDPAAPTPA